MINLLAASQALNPLPKLLSKGPMPPRNYNSLGLVLTVATVVIILLWFWWAWMRFFSSVQSGAMPSAARSSCYRRFIAGLGTCVVIVVLTWVFLGPIGRGYDVVAKWFA